MRHLSPANISVQAQHAGNMVANVGGVKAFNTSWISPTLCHLHISAPPDSPSPGKPCNHKAGAANLGVWFSVPSPVARLVNACARKRSAADASACKRGVFYISVLFSFFLGGGGGGGFLIRRMPARAWVLSLTKELAFHAHAIARAF